MKDPRTYSWTVDTIYYRPSPQSSGQGTISNIWGLNDTLVFAVGTDPWGGQSAMWKFNGKEWQRVKLLLYEGGTIYQALELQTIKGFSPNDIYAFGNHFYTNSAPPPNFIRTAMIIHYDGIDWREVEIPKAAGIISAAIIPPSTIYCGTGEGELLKYTGANWNLDTIKSASHTNLHLNIRIASATADNNLYLQTEQYDPVTGYEYAHFLKYANKTIIPIDSAVNSLPWGGFAFWVSSTGSLYSWGNGGIFRLIDNKWKTVFISTMILTMFGSGDDHIFAVSETSVFFYDGLSWSTVFVKRQGIYDYANIWCSANEVFIQYGDGLKNYVLHGK